MKLGQLAKIARGDNWVLSQYEEYIQNRKRGAERRMYEKVLDQPQRIRTNSWGASASGACLRQRQFTYLGMPKQKPDDKAMNIFANGDFVHIRHQVFGLVAGYIEDVEVPVALPEFNMLGTMDGVLSNGAVLEIKSINTYGFSEVTTFGPKADHKRQMTAYMLASGRDKAHIIYEDKNKQTLKEFVVPLDDQLANEILADLKELQELTEAKTLSPMLHECVNEKGRFNWCPYSRLCESAVWPVNKPSIRITSSSATD